jgi:hypothetical protein
MTLSDLIYNVGEVGLNKPYLDNDLKGFINRAMKAIGQRRDWSFLHDQISVVIPAGQTSVALPDNFKQLAPEKSPVTYTDNSTGRNVPVTVKSRAEIERYNYCLGYPYSRPITVVYIEITASGTNAGKWTLNLPVADPNLQDITFNVSCFTLPTPLVLGTDSNAMTNHGELGEAIINKAKALAYFAEDPSDPKGVAANALYESHYKTAAYSDARQQIVGQSVRM